MKRLNTIQVAQKLYQDENSSSPPSNGGEWIRIPTFDETRQALGKSFAGMSMENGVVILGEGSMGWAANHIMEFLTMEEYQSIAIFGMGFPVYFALKTKTKSLIISKRYKGEVVSAAILLEYNPKREDSFWNKIKENWIYYKAYRTMAKTDKLPDVFSNQKYKQQSKHYISKLIEYETLIRKCHKDNEDGPKETHWYVSSLGVIPEQNGKGLGRQLMEKVNDLADKVGVTCYLESGTSSKGFYEKLGYTVVQRRTVSDPVDSTREPYEFFTMIRKPLLQPTTP